MIRKQNAIRISAIMLLAVIAIPLSIADESRSEITVYKSPTCGCCSKWVTYLEDNDYPVKAFDTSSMDEVKAKLGLTDNRLKSCHTAVVEGYIVEGHVPVSDIERLLKEKPEIKGLTAPGMPMNSPGMASIEPQGYDVYSFDRQGNIEIYSSY